MVTELACFEKPSAVRDKIKEIHGIEVALNRIVYYDPTCSNPKLGDNWRQLFFATRKAFIDDCSRTAISHRAVRLRRIQRVADQIEEKLGGDLPAKNLVLLTQLSAEFRNLLKQAAEEMGDAYTNRRMLINGEPEEELARALGITREQLVEGLAELAATESGNA